jgi:predicted enzyme related to lactoylglutathione lyase
MTQRWTGLTIDCADPDRLATFWSLLLGIPKSSEHGDDPGWATVGSRADALPRLTFQRVPEPNTTKVRIHLDVTTDRIEAGVAQVKELGGSATGQRHDYEVGIVVVMRDPEGHEFCLVQYFT